jgi:hypothetical protein
MHKACQSTSGNGLPMLDLEGMCMGDEKKKRTSKGAFSYLAEAVSAKIYSNIV